MYTLQKYVIRYLPPTQATVMPPSSESENLNKNVPLGQLLSISSACFLRTNPSIELQRCALNIYIYIYITTTVFNSLDQKRKKKSSSTEKYRYQELNFPKICAIFEELIFKNGLSTTVLENSAQKKKK